MHNAQPEVVLDAIDRLYAWHAPRPGLTVLGAYVGRILLTPRRLLFMSSGTNGIARALGFNLVGGLPLQLTLGQTSTEDLDMTALSRPGSLNLELQRVSRCQVARRLDFSNYLVIDIAGNPNHPRSIAFMTRYGRAKTSLIAFRDSLQRARAALPIAPSPLQAEPPV